MMQMKERHKNPNNMRLANPFRVPFWLNYFHILYLITVFALSMDHVVVICKTIPSYQSSSLQSVRPSQVAEASPLLISTSNSFLASSPARQLHQSRCPFKEHQTPRFTHLTASLCQPATNVWQQACCMA